MKSYKDLIVWQKAMTVVEEIYKITKEFPSTEIYGLTSQMRRAAISLVSNIVEGSRRGTRKDFRQFVVMAYGSGAELETQIEISKRLKFSSERSFQVADDILLEVMRMLNKLVESLSV